MFPFACYSWSRADGELQKKTTDRWTNRQSTMHAVNSWRPSSCVHTHQVWYTLSLSLLSTPAGWSTSYQVRMDSIPYSWKCCETLNFAVCGFDRNPQTLYPLKISACITDVKCQPCLCYATFLERQACLFRGLYLHWRQKLSMKPTRESRFSLENPMRLAQDHSGQ